MKKFGLVGGVGYMSTLEYYKGINEGYQKRINSKSKSGEFPRMVIESLNLAVSYELVEKKDWNSLRFFEVINLLCGLTRRFEDV